MSDVFKSRVAAVRSIGSAIRKSDSFAAEIVAGLPLDFDATKSGAITAAIHAFVSGCTCPSGRGKTCQCGMRPDVKVAGKSTTYGQGVDTIGKAVRVLLSGEAADKPVTLRATLSGEGGGTVTIPADHPLYASIVALIGADADA